MRSVRRWRRGLRGEDSVSVAYFGDGGSSKSDFHEGLNFAAVHQLPVVLFCENNGVCILGAIREAVWRGTGLPIGLSATRWWASAWTASDPLQVFRVMREAVEAARAGKGPALIQARVTRLGQHTSQVGDTRAPRTWPSPADTIRSLALRITCGITGCSTRRSKKYSGHAQKAKWLTPLSSPVRRLGRRWKRQRSRMSLQGVEGAESATVQTMAIEVLGGVGFGVDELEQFAALDPADALDATFETASRAASRNFAAGQVLLDRLPSRPNRSGAEQAAAQALHARRRATRTAFLRRHAAALYDALTDRRRRFVRVEELVYRAAEFVPGLVPSRAQIAAERQHPQKDKEGYEVDPGVFSRMS